MEMHLITTADNIFDILHLETMENVRDLQNFKN